MIKYMIHIIYICFFIPFSIFAFIFSLPPSRNSDSGSHRKFFYPLPTTARALHSYREKISRVSSLVVSRGSCACVPTLGALSNCWSLFIIANEFKISPRLDSNSRTNTSRIRGLQLDHRGDWICTRCIAGSFG